MAFYCSAINVSLSRGDILSWFCPFHRNPRSSSQPETGDPKAKNCMKNNPCYLPLLSKYEPVMKYRWRVCSDTKNDFQRTGGLNVAIYDFWQNSTTVSMASCTRSIATKTQPRTLNRVQFLRIVTIQPCISFLISNLFYKLIYMWGNFGFFGSWSTPL